MKTTVAVVNSQGADFSLEEVDLEGPRADEVLVKIVATGLCHTDIHLKGFLPEEMFPNVFGHEGSGVVEASGSGIGVIVALREASCAAAALAARDARRSRASVRTPGRRAMSSKLSRATSGLRSAYAG